MRVYRSSTPQHVGRADAIGASNLAPLAIPHEQVLIHLVEAIEVSRQAGALAHSAEGDLAKASDFRKDGRQISG